MAQQTNNNKQEQGFLRLKSIHDIQVNGEIGILLRSLKESRARAEEYARSLSVKKKQFASDANSFVANNELNNAPNPPISTVKTEEQIDSIKSDKATEVADRPETTSTNNDDAKRFDNKNNGFRTFNNRNDSNRFENRSDRPQNNGFRPREGYNNQNRPPYNPNRQPQQGERRPYDPNRQQNPRAPFTRPGNANGGYQGGYNNNGQRFNGPRQPGAKPFTNANGFAPSRSNNFRNFEAKESIQVLAQPERTVGNKNKNPNKNIEEKKQQSFAKKSQLRNNIIIEDDDGFSETTMGSRKLIKKKKEVKSFVAAQVDNAVITSDLISVKQLSEKTGRPVVEIIKKLMLLGVMSTINSEIDFDTAELVANDLGVKLEKKIEKTYEEKLSDVVEDFGEEENMHKRPPVVAVMGHVDHGKTSLLDAIRETNVVTGEAGGITQKIGAYQITFNGEKITFIDTPGHAAFTEMRARGAKATDIAVLVVAADDGVMPQTKEAISHIKASNVPMIVAINKIDKPTANIDKIKKQLAENDVLPEEWGGDAVLVPVSAKTGEGIDKLLNMVLLCGEVAELKADESKLATGVVLEATLDKNKGPMATILVQNGTLRVGDNVISGLAFGKIKAMYDENGKMVKEALPSCPVSVLGFDVVPNAGDKMAVIDEKLSKKVIEERKTRLKQEQTTKTSGVNLDNFMSRVNEDKLKALNIIIKGDVQGMIEALKATLCDIKNEEAHVVCIHSGVGAVTESDVLLASASQAVIIAFNVKTQPKAKQLCDQLKVEVKDYNIIYQAVDDLTLSINGMLTPKYEESYVGSAEVRMVFKLSSGVIAGCYVKDGKILRNAVAHVKRGNEEVVVTTVEALKIQKDDKSEVSCGYECGIKLKDFTLFKEGDMISVYTKQRIN